VKRKEELEELLQEFEQRLDDGEAQIAAAAAEKKKLMTNVQDLEEQCVLSLIYSTLFATTRAQLRDTQQIQRLSRLKKFNKCGLCRHVVSVWLAGWVSDTAIVAVE